MDTASVSGQGGMAALTSGVIKDNTAQQLITKTLEKVQAAAPQADAAVRASVNAATGVGTRIDLRV